MAHWSAAGRHHLPPAHCWYYRGEDLPQASELGLTLATLNSKTSLAYAHRQCSSFKQILPVCTGNVKHFSFLCTALGIDDIVKLVFLPAAVAIDKSRYIFVSSLPKAPLIGKMLFFATMKILYLYF